MKTFDETNRSMKSDDEEPQWTQLSFGEEAREDEELLAAFLGNPFLVPQQHYERTHSTEQDSISCMY